MQTFKPVDSRISNLYFSWDSKRQPWLKYAKECKELFYHNVEGTKSLYKKKQKKHINDSVGITSSINYIFSTISQAISIAIKNKPSHKITSIDGQSELASQILEKAKFAVLYHSKELIQTRETLKDTFITGLGCKIVIEDYKANKKNLFGIKSKNVPIENVLLDSNVTSPDFENEEGFFIESVMTVANLKKYYADIVKNLIDPETGNPIDIMSLSGSATQFNTNPTDDLINKIEVREFFEPIYTTMYLVQTVNSDVERVFKENETEERLVTLGLDELSEEFIREDIFYKKHLMFGGFVVDETILAQSHSPLSKYYYEWGGSPYESYGMAHYEKEIQEAISAMIRLFILNGILSNNKGYRAEKGNIPPDEKANWEQHATNPQKLKLYTAVVKDGHIIIPEQEKVEPLSAFFPTVLGLLEKGMTSTVGMYPYMAGDPSSQKIEVFSTLSQYQNTAMLRPQMILESILMSEESHGNALIELLLDNLKPNKNYFFFDDNSDYQEFNIANEIVQSIKVFDYILLTIPAEATASQREATAEAYLQIAQSSQDPLMRNLYMEEAARLKNIPGIKKFQEKGDVIKQAQQQLQQMEERLKQAENDLKSMQNRVVTAETSNMVLQSAVGMLKSIAKDEGMIKEIISQTKSQTKEGKE